MTREPAHFMRLMGVVLAFICAVAWAGAGDWPEPRQNPRLTGIQPMAGGMRAAPEVLGTYDLGRTAPSLTGAIDGDGKPVGLGLVHGALHRYAADGALRWVCHPSGLNFESIAAIRDLNGDGSVEVLLKAGRPTPPFGAAALVSLEDGAVLWRHDVDPMSYGWYLQTRRATSDAAAESIVVLMMGYPPDKDNGYIACFDFVDGPVPRQQWRHNFEQYTCFPSLLSSDANGDGVDELIVQTHSRMWVFDAPTGALDQFLQWDVSPANVRSYGRTEFVDLDRDGREDFLCLADFAQHHEVLLNRDGRFEKAWHYGWAESVTTGKVATTWPEPPYGDVDGDGGLEIVVSMFNAEEDGAWTVRVYDAVSGVLKYRYPGVVAATLTDTNGDGIVEVVGNRSSDPAQTLWEGACLLGVAAALPDELSVLWQDDAAMAKVVTTGASGALARGMAAYAYRTQGEPGAMIVKDGVNYRLNYDAEPTLAPWVEPVVTVEPPAPIPAPQVIGRPAPELLAVDVTGDGRNELLMYSGGSLDVFSFADDSLNKKAAVASTVLPAIADLDGDGEYEVVTAEIGPTATPRVRAVGREGQSIWDVQLPDPGRPGLAQPRLGYLRAGRFTGRPGDDIYLYAGAPVVRSVVLRGDTGTVVWERGEVPNSERYWAPTVNLASAWDRNGDGAEDLVFTNPDYYCVASGTTGDFLVGPSQPPTIFNQPCQGLYTYPAILEGPSPLVALVAGHYFRGVMTIDATPRWYRIPVVGEHSPSREGFLQTESGAWLMGYGREDGRFVCVEVETGRERWSMDLNASFSDVITCDVDGDGRFEFVFGTSHGGLVAVGDGGDAPRTVWTKEMGAPVGSPIAADLTGDNAVELVVPTGDGYVKILGTGAEKNE